MQGVKIVDDAAKSTEHRQLREYIPTRARGGADFLAAQCGSGVETLLLLIVTTRIGVKRNGCGVDVRSWRDVAHVMSTRGEGGSGDGARSNGESESKPKMKRKSGNRGKESEEMRDTLTPTILARRRSGNESGAFICGTRAGSETGTRDGIRNCGQQKRQDMKRHARRARLCVAAKREKSSQRVQGKVKQVQTVLGDSRANMSQYARLVFQRKRRPMMSVQEKMLERINSDSDQKGCVVRETPMVRARVERERSIGICTPQMAILDRILDMLTLFDFPLDEMSLGNESSERTVTGSKIGRTVRS
ncbi:hypothetical protein C8R45DRAFT_1133527 [Mycena sanguinolenta]|nr:hypothetical protein C8R45DRAFT_1133527 [Mycena sanguinolenta]